MKAGFIGTGSIGLPLASNILDQEKALAVYDINPGATKSLAEKQARVLSSPGEVANEAEVVFACMPSIESFHAIVSGSGGVLQGSTMKTFVNLGTMGTEAVGAVEAALSEKGIAMLDSPITGGVQRAWDGDITVVTSGPQAVYDQVEPFLQSFARDIHYVGGEVGQAQLVKISNNIMSFTNLVIACEALVMAAKGGVDPEKALAVMNSGSGQNSATLGKVPNFILNRAFNMEAPMHIIEKDAMLWRMEAERLEVPQNVASATYQTMRQALAMGLKDGDLSEMVRVVERAANFELPKTRD
ncbi:MAG: NAD(P)-dependent oxidoreductase [Rhodospirillaceae bacterium]|nr:NAD(P)-dependent oxidoreductase [Rhodospirillaceae bacterium]MBT4486185.1 NAD(P)-dependent oxidoreductase [Rhodospirillaceae bacterium]MBT5193937.1 NAD(P)-dependent oxidoreductase [Rhodospirillaceae bacterium]MBT5898547.1 NAD(P)-dependent oxidoreductase [Rhodospirillaceae bacterium]MBT6426450.1 NAD(P)-dependent oxidoreductase [Rhodospirillaceae bacterium]